MLYDDDRPLPKTPDERAELARLVTIFKPRDATACTPDEVERFELRRLERYGYVRFEAEASVWWVTDVGQAELELAARAG
jgi:hypothetical protein